MTEEAKEQKRASCKQAAGVFHPVVNRGDCEGKKECEEVCPYDVFQVRIIDDADFAKLSFFQKLKVRAHGKLSAYTPKEADCRACGLCVDACPEDAIKLQRV
jgi:4Fe-4S ferredoxin